MWEVFFGEGCFVFITFYKCDILINQPLIYVEALFPPFFLLYEFLGLCEHSCFRTHRLSIRGERQWFTHTYRRFSVCLYHPWIFHKSVSQQAKHLDLRRHVTFPRLCRRRIMKVSLRGWTEKTLCDVLFDILVEC